MPSIYLSLSIQHDNIGWGKHGTEGSNEGAFFATYANGITWTKSAKNPEIFKTYSAKSAFRLYCPCVVQVVSNMIMYCTTKNRAGQYRVCTALIHKFL